MAPTEPDSQDRQPDVEPLDRATRERWVDIAARTLSARAEGRPSAVNELLEAAAGTEPQSPVAPAYRLWAADNLAREGRYALALESNRCARERSFVIADRDRQLCRIDLRGSVGAFLLRRSFCCRRRRRGTLAAIAPHIENETDRGRDHDRQDQDAPLVHRGRQPPRVAANS